MAGVVRPPHLPVKAKRVIHLCMAGGPSQFESLDYKPELKTTRRASRSPSRSRRASSSRSFQNAELKARGPFVDFRKHGQSGQEISDLFPNIAGVADDICIVRSMQTEQINHDPAHAFMNSGSIIKGRPSMGSWLLYGLGSEAEDLPGFIVLTSAGKTGLAAGLRAAVVGGLLAEQVSGDPLPVEGDAVHYIGNPEGVCQTPQRAGGRGGQPAQRPARRGSSRPGDPDRGSASTKWRSRCSPRCPSSPTSSSEPAQMLDLYGVKQPGDGSFASNCLLARRLAERGVRFIQLYHRAWDHHGNIEAGMRSPAEDVDRPAPPS